MANSPRRRSRGTRRRLPPRPTYEAAPRTAAGDESGREQIAHQRASSAMQRESRYMALEMRRVAAVSLVTFGLLIVLTIIDRFA